MEITWELGGDWVMSTFFHVAAGDWTKKDLCLFDADYVILLVVWIILDVVWGILDVV